MDKRIAPWFMELVLLLSALGNRLFGAWLANLRDLFGRD